ncbi:MAG: hypothetical protein EA422_15260 [Gemmatimonadales bacterium]|nr:MAG: hypothetical protein EA422_15260 [Gemmatimonadales bacterium]
MKKRSAAGLLLVLSLAACDPGTDSAWSGVVSDSAGIRVVDFAGPIDLAFRELHVDEGWDPGEGLDFGRVVDLEVLGQGRVAVLDAMSAEVFLLDGESGLIAVLGGPGEGPGEFSPNGLISVTRSDSSIVVPDLQLQRVSEFGLDGVFLGATSLMDEARPGAPVFAVEWRAHPSGAAAYREMTLEGDLVTLRDGEGSEVLLSVEMLDRAPNLLLSPTLVWDMDPEGRIIWGRSDRHEIRLKDPGEAEPRWISRWAGAEAQLSAEDEAHLTRVFLRSAEDQGMGHLPEARRRELLDSVRFPSHRPAITAVYAGPSETYWVQRARPVRDLGMEAMRVAGGAGLGGREWEVYGPEGDLLEGVILPEGFLVRRVHESCLYGILEGELGLQRPARVCVDA